MDRALFVILGPTYQQQLHGELNGVPVEGDADAFVDSQSHDSSEEQQDAGRVRFGESYAVVNYVLKEENIAEASLGMSQLLRPPTGHSSQMKEQRRAAGPTVAHPASTGTLRAGVRLSGGVGFSPY